MLHRIFSIIALVIVISGYAIAQEQEVYGEWGPNETHYITQNSVIPHDSSLVIQYGTTVRFSEDCYLRVEYNATLEATGMDNSPVVFTATEGNEVPGFWQALIASGSSEENRAKMYLTNCEIRYGGEVEEYPLDADGVVRCIHFCDAFIKGCYIHHNYGSGFSTWGSCWPPPYQYPNLLTVDSNTIENCDTGIKLNCRWYTDPIIERNLIENCDYGMKIWAHSGTQIKNNRISNCYPYGVYCPDLCQYPNDGSWIGDFWNNVIDGSKYGIYMENFSNYSTMIRNNIFVNNEYGILAHTQSGYSMTVYYNCFYHNTQMHYNYPLVQSSDGIEDLDPKFIASYSDNCYYHLQWDSPVLGQGDPNPLVNNNNPAHSRCDMGAYGGPLGNPYWVGINGGNLGGNNLNHLKSPYRVFQEFTVDQGQELTIESGEEVQDSCKLMFEEDTEIKVTGTLNILGNNVAPVILTWNEATQSLWKGVTITVGGTSNINYAKIRYADIGIDATDAELYVDNSEITLCGQLGIKAGFTELWMGNNWVHNNEFCGLALCKATAKLYRNEISDNGTNGVFAIDNSSVVADGTFPPDNQATNNIQDNGVLDNAEVDLQYDSQVLFKNGHNNIVDNRIGQTSLMSASNYGVSYPPNNVTYNWWGTNESEELIDLFDPLDKFYYDPWDEGPNGPQSGFDSAWVAYAAAVTLENNGNYLEAIAAYQSVVADFPTSSVALEAIKRVFYLTDTIEGNFLNLVDYYQGIIDTGSFTPLVQAADDLVKRCYVKAHEFQTALNLYEAVVANPPSLADSVFAVIGVGYVYLAAEAGGGFDAPELIAMFPGLRPASYQDYRHHCDELLSLITTTANQQAKKETTALMPLGFALDKPYPNPFNASTRISYSLLESRNVNLAVYDVLGRKVITLTDGRQHAGEYHVIWSGESSTGIPVSSGIYFIRMSTETGVQSAKMLLLK